MGSVLLRGARRDYRLDCTSQASLERIEEATGLPLLELLPVLADPETDPSVAALFLGAVVIDPLLADDELGDALEDIGGLPVIAAAATALHGRADE